MNIGNKITQYEGGLKIELDVYVFQEDGVHIAYSPALDISGYGVSEKDARDSFSVAMDEYLQYVTSNGTLIKDLRAHGWKIKSASQHKIAAPTLDALIKKNATFRDILENKEYRRLSEPFCCA